MNIIKYNVSKSTDTTATTTNSSTSSNTVNGETDLSLATHTLWGLNFNGTLDVSGDINNAGNITADGTITGKELTATDKVTGKDILATESVTANTLNATAGNITNIVSTDVKTNTVEATTGTITTLSGDSETFKQAIIDALQSTNITTDNLTVTKKAHFFSLIIDEIKSVGGLIILSPANATVDAIEINSNGTYRCYWKCKDSDGKLIFNQFIKDDLVICQTFNVGESTTNVSNRYYWRKVVNYGTINKTIDNLTTLCNYIDLSNTDYDTSVTNDIPQLGDKIALLGNRTDTTRLAAIIISAYKSPDSTVEAPSIVQYSGINDYSLSTHKLNQIAKNGNIFKGEFYVSSGQTVEDYVKDNAQAGSDGHTPYIQDGYWYINGTNTGVKAVGTNGKDGTNGIAGTNGTNGKTTYLHIAYSTSSNGQTNFSTTWFSGATYIGVKTDYVEADSTTYSDYDWSLIKGDKGDTGTSGKGISSITNYWLATSSSSGVTTSTSGWSTSTQSVTATNKYLWTYQVTVYTTGTTETVSPHIVGTYGDKGDTGTNGTNGKTSYLHIAYANSSDGSSGFSTTYFSGALYIGTYTDFTESDSTTYSDYTWARLKGQDGTNGTNGTNGSNGADAEFYKLIDNGSYANVNSSKTLSVKLNYGLTKIKGNTSTTQTSLPTGITFRWSFVNDDLSYVGWNSITFSSSLFSYSNTYSNTTNRNNIEVQLLSNSVVIETIIIPVVFTASASFSVTDSINATVTGHTTTLGNLDTRITTNTNNISSVVQKADNIQSTVSSHTTSINTINGKLSTDESNISTLQQTASSLTSTVSSLHTNSTNLFGFNKGINFNNTRPCPEFYGLAVSGKTGGACTNYRIENLGFNGTKGVNETYIVKCKIKMQTTARTLNINLCDVTARNGKSIFNATTDWKDFEGIFDNVNDYNYVGSSNGFLDIENDTESLTNWALIKDLQITKSNIASEFSIANEDSVSDKTNIISDWITNGVTVEDTKIDKYTVYKTNTNPSSTISTVDYYSKNNVTIKDNQTYTLSFWAKANKEAIISSFFYNNIVVPNIPDFCPMDGLTKTTITTDWKHYFIYWHTKLDTSATNYLVKNILPIRLNYADSTNNATAVVEFYGISFMEGYVTEQSYYQSLIKQTADSIELKINNAGISLDDGKITLDATKTTVKGNLSISQYTNGEGLTIYDSDGVPRIELRTDDMSDMTSYVGGETSSSSLSGYYNWSCSDSFELHNTNTSGSTTAPLGTFKAGDSIALDNMSIILATQDCPSTGLTATYNIYLSVNNTQTSIGSGTLVGGSTGTVSINNYTTTAVAGSYSIVVNITLTCFSSYLASYSGKHSNVSFYGRVKRLTLQEIVLAKDGMAINCGSNRWLYSSNEEIQLRWDNEGIRLNSDGIYQKYVDKYGNLAWGAFGSKRHIHIINNTTWNLTNDIDYVILYGANAYLNIPESACMDGRTITVADKATDNGYINFNGNYYHSDSNSKTLCTNYFELPNNVIRRYTYSKEVGAWLEEYLN